MYTSLKREWKKEGGRYSSEIISSCFKSGPLGTNYAIFPRARCHILYFPSISLLFPSQTFFFFFFPIPFFISIIRLPLPPSLFFLFFYHFFFFLRQWNSRQWNITFNSNGRRFVSFFELSETRNSATVRNCAPKSRPRLIIPFDLSIRKIRSRALPNFFLLLTREREREEAKSSLPFFLLERCSKKRRMAASELQDTQS